MKRAVMRLLPSALSGRFRRLQAAIRLRRAERAVAAPVLGQGRPHGLPGELIVSLTSYPPRFPTLAKTLKSLLAQNIRADRTVLWVAHDDERALQKEVLDLRSAGLEIRTCRDIRSYKKIIPTLESWPDSYVVTADDDLYYGPDWLGALVGGVAPDEKVIVCRRAHRPRRNGRAYAPYAEWEWDTITNGEILDDLFPTSGAGALYPPGSLAGEVLDETSFMALSPTADDIWLYCMARLAGSKFRQVGGGFVQIAWPGSQEASLLSENMNGGNDDQLRAVLAEVGNQMPRAAPRTDCRPAHAAVEPVA